MHKPAKAILYGILVWVTGFIWGSIVFMTPALKQVRPIPYISSNPAISFPILIAWQFLTYFLGKNYLRDANNAPSEGLKLGLAFWFINITLDLLVLVFLLKTGFGYFASLTVWTAYLLLVFVPWLAGRSLYKHSAN